MPSTLPFPGLAAACAPGHGGASHMRQLADRLGVPFLDEIEPRTHSDHDHLILQTGSGIVLQQTGKNAAGPVLADFLHGKAGYRRKHGGGRGQLIAKAVGLGKRRAPLSVIDATAGLGQDAFVLATLGCDVRLLERSPLVAALLADGLERLSDDAEAGTIAQRMTLTETDALQWLDHAPTPAGDVIHLDPMFPHRDKAARVKKEMSAFQVLVGADEDSAELLDAALTRARFRVVVKRPRKAPPLAGRAPQLVFEGKSTRYDVYILTAITDV